MVFLSCLKNGKDGHVILNHEKKHEVHACFNYGAPAVLSSGILPVITYRLITEPLAIHVK